jgi:hypothetical protein
LYLSSNSSLEIKEILLKRDHLCGIIFSTLLNYNSKKKNFKVHGYYMACAIDLLQELLEILDLNKSIEHNKFVNILFLITQLITLNLENLKVPQKQEEILNKIIFFIQSYINTKLWLIHSDYLYKEGTFLIYHLDR